MSMQSKLVRKSKENNKTKTRKVKDSEKEEKNNNLTRRKRYYYDWHGEKSYLKSNVVLSRFSFLQIIIRIKTN